MILLSSRFDTPLGVLGLLWDEHGAVRQLVWPDHALPSSRAVEAAAGHPAIAALQHWLADHRRLPGFPLDLTGTPFQQRVWRALADLPAGTTVSYAGLASRIGQPTAVRAVASAVARNPVPLLLPCHRVVGSKGEMTGFSGGLERKRWLLRHEGLRLSARGDRLD